MGSNPANSIVTPERTINKFSKSAQKIEYWAKKTSKEIEKGTFLGFFYITITLILLAIFTILSTGLIIVVGSFFPKQYQWLVLIIASLPLIAVVYVFIKSLK